MSEQIQPNKKVRTISWFILALISVFLFFRSFGVVGQVTFTHNELIQLADQNLERLQCKDLLVTFKNENDSLYSIIGLQNNSIILRDSIIQNLEKVSIDRSKITSSLLETNKALNSQIKSVNLDLKRSKRKLVFWRIFTPVSISAISILMLVN